MQLVNPPSDKSGLVKPGWATSEGQMTAVSVFVGLAVTALCARKIISPADQDTVASLLSAAILGGIALVANALKLRGYIQGRTSVKAGLVLIAFLALPSFAPAQMLPWRRSMEQRLQNLEKGGQQQSPAPAPAPQQILPPIQQPAPAPTPQFYVIPQGAIPPLQQLPIAGSPLQQLPIQGAPLQQLPIQGAPIQQLPIQGQPFQQLPLQGSPLQQLNPTLPSAPAPPPNPAPATPSPMLPLAPQGAPLQNLGPPPIKPPAAPAATSGPGYQRLTNFVHATWPPPKE